MLSLTGYDEQIAQIATDIFCSMLQMEVVIDDSKSPNIEVGALVRFEGAWNGALVIECSLDQAFDVTNRLMRIERPSAFDDNVVDALGELANMIGGNLKALLPPRNILSVPSVFLNCVAIEQLSNLSESARITVQSEIGPFSIRLLEHV